MNIIKMLVRAGTRPARTLLAAPEFEALDADRVAEVLAACSPRNPVLCAVLSLLHQAQAEAAEESNDPRHPEWIAKKFDGGLQHLLQFEAEVKDAVAASPPEKEAGEKSD